MGYLCSGSHPRAKAGAAVAGLPGVKGAKGARLKYSPPEADLTVLFSPSSVHESPSGRQRQKQRQRRVRHADKGMMPIEGCRTLIHRQTAHAHGRHAGISRQLLCGSGRKVGQQQAGGCQGVVSRDALLSGTDRGERDKACRHSATNVLGDLVPKVAVRRLRPTIEQCAIVRGCERHDLKSPDHLVFNSSRRRAKARSKAGVGSGGDRSACAKHS